MFSKKQTSDGGERQGFVKRLRARLNKGDSWLTYDLANLAPGGKIDQDVLDELESLLVMADVGVETTERIISDLQKRLARKELKDVDALRSGLGSSLREILAPVEHPLTIQQTEGPFVILMVGVNGAGKTTTIGKMARRFRDEGYSVMLAAGDTFRAAAVEQLQAWGERNDVPVIAQAQGSDAASVVFDAVQSAQSRGIDVLLVDTAGRLQAKAQLMDELKKIHRVVGRLDETAPHDVILVLDGGVGQNAISQVELFDEAVGLTGLILTKLDGTAKAGVIFAIAQNVSAMRKEGGIPVYFIGVGEAVDDLRPFEPEEFVAALLASDD